MIPLQHCFQFLNSISFLESQELGGILYVVKIFPTGFNNSSTERNSNASWFVSNNSDLPKARNCYRMMISVCGIEILIFFKIHIWFHWAIFLFHFRWHSYTKEFQGIQKFHSSSNETFARSLRAAFVICFRYLIIRFSQSYFQPDPHQLFYWVFVYCSILLRPLAYCVQRFRKLYYSFSRSKKFCHEFIGIYTWVFFRMPFTF